MLVAFSGGLDSSVLAVLARDHAERAVLLTVDTPLISEEDRLNAVRVARELGMEHLIVSVDWLQDDELTQNSRDRCYRCKKKLARIWLDEAARLGLDMVVEGTSATDMASFRPGERALRELGVESPFLRAGVTRASIREFAERVGLSVADRPSSACLATRIPYGAKVTLDRLRMIERMEDFIRTEFGVRCVRARYHGDLVRIEIGVDEMEKVLERSILNRIHVMARGLGFEHAALDAGGYRSGSFDESSPDPGDLMASDDG